MGWAAKRELAIGDKIYQPGDTLQLSDDLVLPLEQWELHGLVEQVEDPKPVKKSVAKKAVAKKPEE